MDKRISSILMILIVLGVLALSGCSEKQATTTEPGSKPVVELPSKYILINRSGTLMTYIGEYTKADPGKKFLVVDMAIQNHGYQEFDINPYYFSVVVDGVVYPHDSASYLLDKEDRSALTSLKVLDGGSIEGSLAFQIPEGKTSYNLKYAGPNSYDIIIGSLNKTSNTPQTPAAPKLPARTITYDVGDGQQTGTPDYVKSVNGALVQSVIIQPGHDSGYANVTVETLQSGGNVNQIVSDAQKMETINGFTSNEKGARNSALADGSQIRLSVRQNPMITTGHGSFEVGAFSTDQSTAVIITSTLSQNRMDALLKTLKIGVLA